jgi:hypothetical protein
MEKEILRPKITTKTKTKARTRTNIKGGLKEIAYTHKEEKDYQPHPKRQWGAARNDESSPEKAHKLCSIQVMLLPGSL